MAHAPGVLKVVLGDGLQQHRFAIAGPQQPGLIAAGDTQRGSQLPARIGSLESEVVIAPKHLTGLRQEVVGVEPPELPYGGYGLGDQ